MELTSIGKPAKYVGVNVLTLFINRLSGQRLKKINHSIDEVKNNDNRD